ncbi:MAG TPA: arsenate reductase family protein [Lactovum miscens]
MYQFYWYSKCSTCQKAKKQLELKNISYETCDLIQNTPSVDQFEKWMKQGDFEMKKFFNTSGIKYRELGLKDRVPNFTIKEAAKMLASDGMLVKRPLVLKEDHVVQIGYNKEKYEDL